MKSTLILLLAFFACFLFQTPAFAGSANQNATQIASVLSPAPQSTSKVSSQAPQKWVNKLANSKVGKWVGKVAQGILGTKDFNIGGFCLGFFLSWVGVIVAYVMKDDDMIKWAWIGFGASALLGLLIYVILVVAVFSQVSTIQ